MEPVLSHRAPLAFPNLGVRESHFKSGSFILAFSAAVILRALRNLLASFPFSWTVLAFTLGQNRAIFASARVNARRLFPNYPKTFPA